VLLEALGILEAEGTPLRARLVGDGPRREALERLAADLGIAHRLDFAGAMAADRVPLEYPRADIFCMSSFAEGVPIVLMEAMASGLPVVAPAITAIPELVEDGVSGLLVRPGRADLLADALRRLARDPELRETMGRAGREKVVREFDIDSSARRVAAMLSEVVSADRPTVPAAADAPARPSAAELH
jgi:glycosyltransferase involved in cell wall biosynthesis